MMTTPVRHDVEPIIEFPKQADPLRWTGFLAAERIARPARDRDRPASASAQR